MKNERLKLYISSRYHVQYAFIMCIITIDMILYMLLAVQHERRAYTDSYVMNVHT